MTQETLLLPALRAKMGDWTYYIASMALADLAERVTTASALHQSKRLEELIQRSLSPRAGDIAEYLRSQPQRLFGTLVIAVYGGEPEWIEIEIGEEVRPWKEGDERLDGVIRNLPTILGQEAHGLREVFPEGRIHRPNPHPLR